MHTALSCRSWFILTGLLAACSNADRSTPRAAGEADAAAPPASSASSSDNLVHVVATDYKLEIPAKIPAGAVSMHLMNEGKEMHQAVIVRLEDGKTVADLAQGMKAEGPPPPWMKFVGGPNGIAPGATTTATTLLTPGQYAVLCFIPSPDGTPHVAKGMMQPFEVTAAAGAAAVLPVADDTVRLIDYGFETSHPLTPGSHTILVENKGPQVHEVVLLKLEPGKSAKDFGEWATTGKMKGPPPALPIGGVGPMEKEFSSVFKADLAPGEYAFICFIPDAKDGKMHLQHGMVTQFRVG
jgi:hypothetical protein